MVIFVTRPLYKNEVSEPEHTSQDEELLADDYYQSLSRIRDLEQEHLEGKISDEDYQQRREMLNKEAAESLHKLDADNSVRD
jgi:hypothetical protein